MDSFTLGLLPKIDFNYEHNNSTPATLGELADLHNVYLNTFSKYGKILLVFWPNSVFDKITCVCKDVVNRDFTIQSTLKILFTAKISVPY
jgi:hypothetical protein